MGKQFLTTLFVLLLLAPQADLEARGGHHARNSGPSKFFSFPHSTKRGGHHARNSGPSKFFRFPHSTKDELESLKEAIEDINEKIDDLEEEFDDDLLEELEELEEALEALQSAVDTNSGEVAYLLEQVSMIIKSLTDHGIRLDALESTLADLGVGARLATLESTVVDLELRISSLEQSGPPPAETDVTFSGIFAQGHQADDPTTDAWSVFKKNATGMFTSIEIKNSLGGSAVCAEPIAATRIAKQLNIQVPNPSGTPTTVPCGGLMWNVGTSGDGVELNASLDAGVNACNQGATVRPLVGNINWGGVGSDFGGFGSGGLSGGTCNAPTQTLEVILVR